VLGRLVPLLHPASTIAAASASATVIRRVLAFIVISYGAPQRPVVSERGCTCTYTLAACAAVDSQPAQAESQREHELEEPGRNAESPA